MSAFSISLYSELWLGLLVPAVIFCCFALHFSGLRVLWNLVLSGGLLALRALLLMRTVPAGLLATRFWVSWFPALSVLLTLNLLYLFLLFLIRPQANGTRRPSAPF